MRKRFFSVRAVLLLIVALMFPHAAWGHVGSKDVFEQVDAGPYRLYVTVRTPVVIPGVATIQVRSSGAAVDGIRITPLPMTGEASKHPPTSDAMVRSASDPAFFTGSLWMMAPGSWEVRFEVSGAAGQQVVSVPVPAVALSTLKMQRGLGMTLGVMGLFLMIGMAGIVAAAVREARLQPGAAPSPERRRRAVLATVGSLVLMGLMVWGGAKWWNVEAANYSSDIYRPLGVEPVLTGNQLDLKVTAYAPTDDLRKRTWRLNDDFLPDHGHLMHLYAIRQPEMDAVFHLHPVLASAGDFRVALPAVMPAGEYRLYGDVVHANGFPETLVATMTVPDSMSGNTLGIDDAAGSPQPLSKGMLGSSYTLPDGYAMVWDRPETLTANTGYAFRFRLLDATGKPAADMQPYLGMAGHAAFVKTDGTVFAHTHPQGSAAMAALMLANGDGSNGVADKPMNMSEHMPMHAEPISNAVEFPYGFPLAGRYRIFVQMKHGATVETGAFDVMVQ
jgi:hypothetical protein